MMSRYEPINSSLSLRTAMDRLFQDSFVPSTALRQDGSYVPVDLHETADDYVITASLAGWKPEDVKVTVQDNTVTIAAEHQNATPSQAEKEKTFHLRERTMSSFQRQFTFPTALDATRANADFEHGVLTLTLPKAESGKPRQIKVTTGMRTQPTVTTHQTPASPQIVPEKQPAGTRA
jgi:HSP20 family protein